MSPVCTRTRLARLVTRAFLALLAPLAAYVVLLATGSRRGRAAGHPVLHGDGGRLRLAVARASSGRTALVWRLLAGALVLWVAGTRGGSSRDLPASRPPTCCTSRSTSSRSPGSSCCCVAVRRERSATLWADGWVASLGGRVGGRLLLRRARRSRAPRREPARAARQPRLPDRRHAPAGARRGRDRRDARQHAPSWAAMCAALVAMAVSDGIYLNLSWSGSYADGTLLEAGWVVAALCLSWSLWLTYAEPSERRMTTDRAPIVWPVLWGGGIARPRRGARHRRRRPPDLDRARRRRASCRSSGGSCSPTPRTGAWCARPACRRSPIR